MRITIKRGQSRVVIEPHQITMKVKKLKIVGDQSC